MDIVYPYRKAPGDFELRFSLRSLANVPHDRVIVAGDHPKFASKALIFIPAVRRFSRYAASTHNILTAAEKHVRGDRFMVMNDDIFVLAPYQFRHEHRCTIDEYLESGAPKGDYRKHLVSTQEILKAQGVDRPLFFGLHTPTVYEREKFVRLVKKMGAQRYLLRTLYHNLFPQPSVRRDDVKVRQWVGEPASADVLSISDECARDPRFAEWISARFPDPSPYEAAERRKAA